MSRPVHLNGDAPAPADLFDHLSPVSEEPSHSCHGAIFCGQTRSAAQAECPACQDAA